MAPPRFACESARPRTVRLGGLALAAREWGEPGRPPVLLLHGGAAHAHWFDFVAPPLADRFHVLALDQRGHGESAWASPAAYATEDFAGDLLGVMDALGWDRAAIVGHSMGGHNAMAFAAWHADRVGALVVVDARPAIPEERLGQMRALGRRPLRVHASLEAAAGAFRLLPPETGADPALVAHLARASFVARDGEWTYRFDPACYGERKPVDAWTLVGGIRAPTLIVRGELSPILPREMAERLAAAIPGAAIAEIPGAWHHLVLDRPEAFTAVLGRFLACHFLL